MYQFFIRHFLQRFSCSLQLAFNLLSIVFCRKEVFNFNKVKLIKFFFFSRACFWRFFTFWMLTIFEDILTTCQIIQVVLIFFPCLFCYLLLKYQFLSISYRWKESRKWFHSISCYEIKAGKVYDVLEHHLSLSSHSLVKKIIMGWQNNIHILWSYMI